MVSYTKEHFEELQKENLLLKKKIESLQDEHFIEKLDWVYQLFHTNSTSEKLPLKRGAGKAFISRLPDNFTDELTDFNDLDE